VRAALRVICIAAAAWLGAGCGGGGGDESAPAQGQALEPTVAGLYFGTADGGRFFDALILNNGRMYAMLGTGSGVSAVFFGSGTVTAAGFTSTAGGTLTTNSGDPLAPATVTLSGTPRTSATGTLTGTGPGLPAPFTLRYDASFEGTPEALAALAGTYQGNSSGLGRPINLDLVLDAAGGFTGTSSDNCPHTGTLTPSASANVYAVSITFQQGCPRRGPMTGYALWSPPTTATPQATLTIFTSASDPSSAFALGWVFFGGRL
jgi:hypothetical protein